MRGQNEYNLNVSLGLQITVLKISMKRTKIYVFQELTGNCYSTYSIAWLSVLGEDTYGDVLPHSEWFSDSGKGKAVL